MFEEEVKFAASIDNIPLIGTFAKPDDMAKGAILMIVGSGKVDRDETIPAGLTYTRKTEKLFKVLSDELVASGFCTFRYNKRGVLDDKGNVDREIWRTYNREHLTSDSKDAAKILLEKSNLSLSKFIILGHSEGTIIAVECAIALGGKLSGLILLSSIGRPFIDLIRYQLLESRINQPDNVGPFTVKDFDDELEYINTTSDIFHRDDDKPISYFRQFIEFPGNADRIRLVESKLALFQGEKDFVTPKEEISVFQQNGITPSISKIYKGLGHAFSRPRKGEPTLGPFQAYVINDIVKAASCFVL